MPLLHFDDPPSVAGHTRRTSSSRAKKTRVPKSIRRVWHLVVTYGPAVVAVALILSAMPSIILVTIAHHYKVEGSINALIAHIFVACLLTFMSLSSFIVCIARDPGPVAPLKSREEDTEHSALHAPSRPGRHNDELSLAEALAGPSIGDSESSGEDSDIEYDDQGEKSLSELTTARIASVAYSRWIIIAHGWQIVVSLGHRTYPSFIHFLLYTTLIAAHAASVSVSPLKWYFNNGIVVEDLTPLHALYLALGGAVFTVSMGSFVGFHAYLVTTGQTTLEQLSPYMLLRYLPPASNAAARNSDDSRRSFESDIDLRAMLNAGPDDESQPSTDSSLLPSSRLSALPVYPPPGHEIPVASRGNAAQLAEHTMTREQRRIVRSASGKIYIYDLGWRRNWSDLYAIRPERYLLDLVELIWWGGHGSKGDGRAFVRNPKAARMLQRLRERLDGAS